MEPRNITDGSAASQLEIDRLALSPGNPRSRRAKSPERSEGGGSRRGRRSERKGSGGRPGRPPQIPSERSRRAGGGLAPCVLRRDVVVDQGAEGYGQLVVGAFQRREVLAVDVDGTV